MNLNKMNCQKYVVTLFCSKSSPILELSVKFGSQICHENINKQLDGAYLADFGIDIMWNILELKMHAIFTLVDGQSELCFVKTPFSSKVLSLCTIATKTVQGTLLLAQCTN